MVVLQKKTTNVIIVVYRHLKNFNFRMFVKREFKISKYEKDKKLNRAIDALFARNLFKSISEYEVHTVWDC